MCVYVCVGMCVCKYVYVCICLKTCTCGTPPPYCCHYVIKRRFVRRRRDLIIQSHVQNAPRVKVDHGARDMTARDMTARIQIACLVVLVCLNVLWHLRGIW